MAYVTPTTRTLAEQITPAIWNQDVVNNSIAVKALVDPLGVQKAAGHIVSSAAETTIFSTTISGNSLNANGFLTIDFQAVIFNNVGAIETVTFRVKFGGTTFHALGFGPTQHATNRAMVIGHVTIANNNNTSAQLSTVRMESTTVIAANTPTTSTLSLAWNTGSINTASDQTLAFTVQLSSSSASLYADVIANWLKGPVLQA